VIDDAGAFVALAKAAVLAHWIPGVGLHVRQPGQLPLRVAAFDGQVDDGAVDLHPCAFRAEVLRCRRPHDAGLVDGAGPDASVAIDCFTDGVTRFGPGGLAQRPLDGGVSVVAFTTLTTADPVEVARRHDAAVVGPLPIEFGHLQRIDVDEDPDLGVTLVHCCLPSDDEVAEQAAFELMLDLMITCAANEVEGTLAWQHR
jgi:hypothetical protein